MASTRKRKHQNKMVLHQLNDFLKGFVFGKNTLEGTAEDETVGTMASLAISGVQHFAKIGQVIINSLKKLAQEELEKRLMF